MTCSAGGSSAAFLGWLGQAVLVGLGWYAVHHLSVRRDLDKARREMLAASVDGLIDSVTTLFDEARAYHLGSRSEDSEITIKMSLQDLANALRGLDKLRPDLALLAKCRSEVALLRKAITGKHFEDEHEQPLMPGDAIVQSVAEVVLRTKRSLLELKHTQFS